MKSKSDVIEMIEQLLDGRYNCMDFSYDMPDLLFEVDTNDFPREFIDEIPTICANYDPPLKHEGYLDDEAFIKEIKKYYEMIK